MPAKTPEFFCAASALAVCLWSDDPKFGEIAGEYPLVGGEQGAPTQIVGVSANQEVCRYPTWAEIPALALTVACIGAGAGARGSPHLLAEMPGRLGASLRERLHLLWRPSTRHQLRVGNRNNGKHNPRRSFLQGMLRPGDRLAVSNGA
jgi:hypothetical protein